MSEPTDEAARDGRTESVSLDSVDAAGRTVLFEGAPKTVSLTLAACESIPPHRHPGARIVLYVRSGRLDLTLETETRSLSAGDVVRFDGAQDIALAAATDCAALLVFG